MNHTLLRFSHRPVPEVCSPDAIAFLAFKQTFFHRKVELRQIVLAVLHNHLLLYKICIMNFVQNASGQNNTNIVFFWC